MRDGHHRVSVARAFGDTAIDAHVRVVSTALPAEPELRARDLPRKRHERIFRERVPLPADAAARVVLADPLDYARLAELVEAWAYRTGHEHGRLLARDEAALAWFRDEFEPTVRDAGGGGTEAQRYLRAAALRPD